MMAQIKDRASDTMDTVRSGLQSAGQQVGEWGHDAAQGMRQGYQTTRQAIRQNPETSLLIGLGVGLGIGLGLGLMLARPEPDPRWYEALRRYAGR